MIEVELDEKTPVVGYGDDTDPEVMTFVRLCPNCGRFVKADNEAKEPAAEEANATCAKCGRVKMIFAGWWLVD